MCNWKDQEEYVLQYLSIQQLAQFMSYKAGQNGAYKHSLHLLTATKKVAYNTSFQLQVSEKTQKGTFTNMQGFHTPFYMCRNTCGSKTEYLMSASRYEAFLLMQILQTTCIHNKP